MTLTEHFNSKSKLTSHFNAKSKLIRREEVETETFGAVSLASRFCAPVSAARKQEMDSTAAFETLITARSARRHSLRGMTI